jgi:hypothetical protein
MFQGMNYICVDWWAFLESNKDSEGGSTTMNLQETSLELKLSSIARLHTISGSQFPPVVPMSLPQASGRCSPGIMALLSGVGVRDSCGCKLAGR